MVSIRPGARPTPYGIRVGGITGSSSRRQSVIPQLGTVGNHANNKYGPFSGEYYDVRAKLVIR